MNEERYSINTKNRNLRYSSDTEKLIVTSMFFSFLLIFFSNTRYLYLFGYIIFIIPILYFFSKKLNRKIDRTYITEIDIFILLFCFVTGFFFSKYSLLYTVLSFGVLFSLIEIQKSGLLKKLFSIQMTDIFYYVLLVSVIVLITHDILQKKSEIVFYSIEDKNYTGIFIFLFFLLANKKRKYTGILLGLIYCIFFSYSRSCHLLFCLFYLFKIFERKRLISFLSKIDFNIILFFSFCFIAVFSYIWVYQISIGTLANYREGLNDLSNRMRFVANIYGLQMLSDLYNTLLWGYGSSLLQEIGIEDNILYYMDTKLVQPHNSILNLMLKIGIIPAIIYLKILTKLWKKLKKNYNYPYIIPYIVNCMFMHSLFNTKWLIFFLLILMIPEKQKRENK